jgi:ribosome-associated protein
MIFLHKSMKGDYRHFKNLAVSVARVCGDKKAKNIKVVDLLGKSSLTDFVVIATVESSPQLEAIEAEIIKTLKQKGTFRLHRDGGISRSWRVYDYGGFFVHLMAEEERQFYSVDKIYHFGKFISWHRGKSMKSKTRAASKPKGSKKTKAAGGAKTHEKAGRNGIKK